MAINYTWKINSVDAYPSMGGNSNVIHQVHWELRAEDDENQDDYGDNIFATNIGAIPLKTSDIENFIEFDDITTETLIGWVESALGAGYILMQKENLVNEISKKITPVSVNTEWQN